MYWLIIISGIIVILAFLVWASACIGSGVYLKALCRGEGPDKKVALTFDDGPDETMIPKVLDVLRRNNVKAAFFLVGSKVAANPELVRRIVGDGHIVANHTYTHKWSFPLGTPSSADRDISLCSEAIADATGLNPGLFRPPFGVTNPIVAGAVKRSGLQAIGWSVRSLDTVAGKGRDEICRRVMKRLHPGAVILLHDRCPQSDILLERLISEIRAKGYDFVGLEDLFNVKIYEN